MIEFRAWPKIARWSREVTVTEKIDGTNGAVVIELRPDGPQPDDKATYVDIDGKVYAVAAQSRSRLITPDQDNHGFARWVYDNAPELADRLGEGRHFGEWWGKGIQRGYGMDRKVFSLFNTSRWGAAISDPELGLDVVPVLGTLPAPDTALVRHLMRKTLVDCGSFAARHWGVDYRRPEGVVLYHTAANLPFKMTIENDDQPKSVAA